MESGGASGAHAAAAAAQKVPNGPSSSTPVDRKSSESRIDDIWVQTFTNDGKPYYYNTRTFRTLWERPLGDNVVSENDIEWLDEEEDSENVAVKIIESFEKSRSGHQKQPQTLNEALEQIRELQEENRYANCMVSCFHIPNSLCMCLWICAFDTMSFMCLQAIEQQIRGRSNRV